MQFQPRGGYSEHYQVKEVVEEDFIVKDDNQHSSGGMHMNPANHWNSQPKRGYENHFIHGYDSQADCFGGGHNGYRAQFSGERSQFSGECYNDGYNGAWNERHGYGGHGAYKGHNEMPHDAMRYDGFGGQRQHQHQHQHQQQHHGGQKPFWIRKAIQD